LNFKDLFFIGAAQRVATLEGHKHYLVVLAPRGERGWRAHFPDFPGCGAEGSSVRAAVDGAAVAAAEQARWLRAQGVSLPKPQLYEDVRYLSNGWAAEREIDWSRAIASFVKLPIYDNE
jgi:predicted RNase H-like HicB family nuclease